MNEIERQNLTTAYLTPLFHFELDILTNANINVTVAIANMQPNENVIALGLVAFLLHNGLTPDQVIERFIVNSHAD